tara:strand:- start:3349 stop:3564 length:216 start_codon:yes stop_codon:yes gene_type:complete
MHSKDSFAASILKYSPVSLINTSPGSRYSPLGKMMAAPRPLGNITANLERIRSKQLKDKTSQSFAVVVEEA